MNVTANYLEGMPEKLSLQSENLESTSEQLKLEGELWEPINVLSERSVFELGWVPTYIN